MKRLLALLAALALVAGAWFARRAIEGGTADPTGGGGSNDISVLCDDALTEVCRAAFPGSGTRIEIPGASADRLAGADATAPDLWLTVGPWPEMVDLQRQQAGRAPLFGSGRTIASTQVVLVARPDRARVLREGPCKGTEAWKCLAGAIDQPWTSVGGSAGWGRLRPGHSSADASSGLFALAGMATSWFGTEDVATNDFEDDPDFLPFLTRTEQAVPDFTPSQGSPFRSFLLTEQYSLVSCLGAEVGVALRDGTSPGRVAAVPFPGLSVAVRATPRASSSTRLPRSLDGALADAQFATPSRTTPEHVLTRGPSPEFSESTLDPGILVDLRARWDQIGAGG